MIITLDGQSGTGKSTLASLVAKELGYKYLNTGMIYRALTYFFLKKGVIPNDIEQSEKLLTLLNVQIKFFGDNQTVFIDNFDVTPFVSNLEVQQNVSLFSQILPIREKVTKLQKEYAQNNNVVVEGRDIGTCVFPNAEYKFFVKCDINVRAKRRLDDLKKLGQNLSMQEVIDSLMLRDKIDTTRKYSPLIRPDDAIDIDTSNSTIAQSVNEILKYIKN